MYLWDRCLSEKSWLCNSRRAWHCSGSQKIWHSQVFHWFQIWMLFQNLTSFPQHALMICLNIWASPSISLLLICVKTIGKSILSSCVMSWQLSEHPGDWITWSTCHFSEACGYSLVGSFWFCLGLSRCHCYTQSHLGGTPTAPLSCLWVSQLCGTVNAAKSTFAKVGYFLGKEVIKPQIQKVQVIQSSPLPQTRTRLKFFLGMVGW